MTPETEQPARGITDRRSVKFAIQRGEDWLKVKATGIEGSGWREHGWLQAPGNRPVRVTVVNPELEFRWDDPELDPPGDAIAAAVVFAFFPSLAEQPTDLTFDWATSSRFADGLGLLPADLRLVRGPPSEPFDPIPGEVLSFGGGLDSLSMTVLYPHARLVYEAPLTMLTGQVTSAVVDGAFFKERNGVVVYTNQRSLYDTWGVGSWPSVLVAAAFTGRGTIVSGLNAMDNAYLTKGYGYQDPETSVDQRFFDFLEKLGFRVVQTMWKSEVASAAILESAGLADQAAYCGRIPVRDCGRCIKCLRRRVLKVIATGNPGYLDGFEPDTGTLTALAQRPMAWGHVFGLAFQKRLLPGWLEALTFDELVAFERMDFLERYYQPAFLPSRVAAVEMPSVLSALEGHSVRAMGHADHVRLTSFR